MRTCTDNRGRIQMFRRAAAILVALTIFPAVLHAQDTVFTVSVQSADVHKAPSTAAPVVGHAASGTVLPVVRNLGSWLKVPFALTPEGIGYVHLTTGRLNARGANTSTSAASPRASAGSTSAPAPVPLTT